MKFRRGKQLPGYMALVIITLIAGLALGATYGMTEERIEAQAVIASQNARTRVLPEADAFEQMDDSEMDWTYCALKDGKTVGYVAQTTVQGFDGEIEIICGIDREGRITGISVGGASFSETPGLGAKSKEDAFTSRFIGKTAPLSVVKAGEAGGENGVDAITSATITSTAVVNGVNDIAGHLMHINAETEGAE